MFAAPRLELSGSKWVVENFSGRQDLEVINDAPKNSVYVYGCTDCVIQVPRPAVPGLDWTRPLAATCPCTSLTGQPYLAAITPPHVFLLRMYMRVQQYVP